MQRKVRRNRVKGVFVQKSREIILNHGGKGVVGMISWEGDGFRLTKPQKRDEKIQKIEKSKTFGVTADFHSSRKFYESFPFSAVSDAIRTSLGPRGMDKMVRQPRISNENPSHLPILPDSSRQRRSHNHKRRRHDPQTNERHPPCCKDARRTLPRSRCRSR
jgi:hypothetical protein